MSANRPIVPSRKVLRALRRLAYGGSTIIGAVGSLFTVAGVSYDTHRRVRLAERLIETKRTIRSLSNSNGAAHVARMFEAAEKGEDFGLGITRSRKRNMRRDYSALTMESSHQRTAAEIGPVGSHHRLIQDETSDRALAKKEFRTRKASVTSLPGSTRISAGSLSSPRWAKRLPAESPTFGQPQLVRERSCKTATSSGREAYDDAQAVTELPYTRSPGAGRMLLKSHPAGGDMPGAAARKNGVPTNDPPHKPHQSTDPGGDLEESQSTVERILLSTQQQHKLHDHGVYGRAGKEPLARRGKADASAHNHHGSKSNSSAAEKIVAATQKQHKLHSHAVYGRPGKANTEFHARLNEHVALWLNSEGEPGKNSGPKYDSGVHTGILLGGTHNSKRPGWAFPGDALHHKHLRRNFSTSANKADQAPQPSPAATLSLQQKDTQESSNQYSRPSRPISDDHTTLCARETNQSVPSDEQRASTRSGRRRRRERVAHWSRRYSHYSLFSSKDQTTALEANQELVYDKRVGPPSKKVTPPIALNLHFKPWPASVSGSFDVPENSFAKKSLPQNLQSEDNQTQHTESSVINDLSELSPTNNVTKPTVQEDAPRRNDAFFDSDRAFDECLTICESEGYAVWDEFIHTTIQEHGAPAARQFWLKAMAYYAAPGDTRDWDLVNNLHRHFHKKFWRALPPYLDFDSGRLLTRHVLEIAPTSQRAAELLFPLDGREMDLEADFAAQGIAYPTVQRSRNLFANASKYLMDLWDRGNDAEKVICELRKVIRITNMQEIELAEDLFFGTIRRLSSCGQIEKAQTLFDEMAYYHQIEPSFLTRSVLVCGHARAGDWDRVAKEVEAMHNIHDLSRREPLGYSLMFNNVLIEYASRRSVAQTHDFLVHALGYWGLVPTSAISATAIRAFLAHQRFDLVREWIETVRILFPQVDTETSRFAWHLGSIWEDINASCVEVEEACKALCYRKDASKVQASLREMVRLALARDLATKLHAAEVAKAGGERKDTFPAGSPWALSHFLERAQSIASDPSAQGESQTAESQEARELLSQVESVARLDRLFGTGGKFTDPPSVNVHESSQPRSSQNRTGMAHTASLQSPVPTDLMRDLLPNLQEVESLLDEYYSARQARGLAANHAILKYTCQKLRKHDRRFDAMQLLKTTFDGPYVQSPTGAMFDLSIMEMWLRFAYEAKSLSHCLTVFWAVLDAGEEHVLTSKFVLLANMSYHKIRRNRFGELARTNPSKHEELGYLLNKLRRKLWVNNEGARSASDKSRSAGYRKLRHQMKQRLVVGKQEAIEVPG